MCMNWCVYCVISKHFVSISLVVGTLFAHDSILWEITTSFIQYLPWAVALHDIYAWNQRIDGLSCKWSLAHLKKCVIAYIHMGKCMRMDREYFAMVVGVAVAIRRLKFQQSYRWNVEWNKLRLLWLTPIGYASKILRLSLWWWILISARIACKGFRSFEQKNNGVWCEQPFFARFSFRSSKLEKHEFSREITPAWHEKGEKIWCYYLKIDCLLCLKIMFSKMKSSSLALMILLIKIDSLILNLICVVNGKLNSHSVTTTTCAYKEWLTAVQIDPPFETERLYPQTCVF